LNKKIPPLLSAILLLLPIAVRAETPPVPGGCSLSLEMIAIQDACTRAEVEPEVCSWIPVFEAFVQGPREAAAEKLASAFHLEPEVAARILAASSLFSIEMISDTCPIESLTSLMNSIMNSGPLQEATRSGGNASIALMMRLLVFDPKAIEVAAPQMGAFGKPDASRALDALVELVTRAGLKDKFAAAMSGQNPVLTGYSESVSNPSLTSAYSEELAKFAEPLAATDTALELAARGRIRESREAIEAVFAAADDQAKGLALARAGWGFMRLFLLEDALSMFTRALPWLDRAKTQEKICKGALYLVALGRRLVLSASRIPDDRPKVPVDPELEPVLELMSSALDGENDPKKLEQILPTMMQGFASGKFKAESLQTMMLALEATFPGMADFKMEPPVAEELQARPEPVAFLKMTEQLLLKDFTGATGTWEAAIAANPHPNQLVGGMLVALAALKKGDQETARKVLIQGVELLEQHLGTQRLDELAHSSKIAEMSAMMYYGATDVTAVSGHSMEAFTLTERGRAFTLRRLLGAPRAAVPSGALSADEQLVLKKIAQIDHDPTADRRELPALYRSFESARLDRQLANARGETPPFPVPVDIATLQREVLGPEEILLAYFPGFEGRLWVWRITANEAELTTLHLSDGGEVICLAQVLRWHGSGESEQLKARARGAELLHDCPGQPDGGDPANVLYEKLIAPIEAHLPHGRRLILVPYGEMHGVPFAALRNPRNGRRLAEIYQLAVEPSADTLARLRRLRSKQPQGSGRKPGKPLVLGDPDTHLPPLSAARSEADTVARFLGVKPLLGGAASEAALVRNAPEASVLHIAAHGIFVPESPLFSSLKLAPGDGEDGSLQVHEVWDRLDLGHVRLVVLSACDTAIGRQTQGDEILGLTQSFLLAGAPAVIATLWPVDDAASARLMTEFYRRFQQGATAAAALREAQVALLADSKTAAPYYWAGYTLVGDPEARWSK
jgi:hypothetical protein